MNTNFRTLMARNAVQKIPKFASMISQNAILSNFTIYFNQELSLWKNQRMELRKN